jgi:hypothetical protein
MQDRILLDFISFIALGIAEKHQSSDNIVLEKDGELMFSRLNQARLEWSQV